MSVASPKLGDGANKFPCTCGAEKAGSPGHSEWCETNIPVSPKAEDLNNPLFESITDEDIDRLFKAIDLDIKSGRITDMAFRVGMIRLLLRLRRLKIQGQRCSASQIVEAVKYYVKQTNRRNKNGV